MAASAPRKPASRKRSAKPPKSAKAPPAALAAYRKKRDFEKTREPAGGAAGAGRARFVVQKHAATRLHYDFRLEMGGVLKSWAVPKGIPLRAGEKALAVMVEDHPVEYGKFEGTIPKGQYGGGTVMLWDRGTYRPEAEDPVAAIGEGKLHLHLTGKKLRGEWALIKMRREENQWLLIKAGDNLRAAAKTWEVSASTGRTMEEIGATRKVWTRKVVAKEPEFIVPMKAKPMERLPTGDHWIYELKFDGYRFLATKGGDKVHLWSRTERDMSARFPRIAQAIRELPCATAILDGELVVSDERGCPSFQLIQNADANTPVQAFVFDLVQIEGEDLRKRPLDERRERLAGLLTDRAPLHFSPALEGEAESLIAMIAERGLEGIVAKRRDSVYEPDRRSGAWVKVKCAREQEFVVGGFTPPKGSRSHFGSLLLGFYRGKKLIFAGRAGTGFDQKMLVRLHRKMRAIETEECPFEAVPTGRNRWGGGFTRAELARCTWLKPELVAQVRFAEWTSDGILRQPAFLGLREDKKAREVRREG